MQDILMIKTALVMVLAGLPVLGALWVYAQPPVDNVALLTKQTDLAVNGTIITSATKGGITRAMLQTCMDVPLVIFDSVSLSSGQKVVVRGKKESYKGRLQLVVDSIN